MINIKSKKIDNTIKWKLLCMVLFNMFLISAVKTQNVKTEWSKPFAESGGSMNPNAIKGIFKGHLVIEQYKVNSITWVAQKNSIILLDKNTLARGEEHVILGNPKNNPEAIDIDQYSTEKYLILKNKMYVLVRFSDYWKKSYSIFANEIDENGKLKGELKKILEAEQKIGPNTHSLRVVPSSDSTRFVIFFLPKLEFNLKEKLSFTVLDENLETKGQYSAEMPYKAKSIGYEYDHIDYDQIEVAADNKVYLLTHKEKDVPEANKTFLHIDEKSPGLSYKMLQINNDKIQVHEIQLENKEIWNAHFKIIGLNNFLFAGVYSDGNDKTLTTKGVFCQELNTETKAFKKIMIMPFDEATSQEFVKLKSNYKRKVLSFSYDVKSLERSMDGSIYVVQEFAFIMTKSSGGTSFTDPVHSTDSYYNHNILVTEFASDGTAKMHANIAKRQYSKWDGGIYNSFFYSLIDNKQVFIYNDHKANLQRFDGSKLVLMQKAPKEVCMIGELSADGTYTKKVLFDCSKKKFAIQPLQMFKIDNH